jgi:hypothetical protein
MLDQLLTFADSAGGTSTLLCVGATGLFIVIAFVVDGR